MPVNSNTRIETDRLIAVAKKYYLSWPHSDSALKYANLAFQKASTVNYKPGIAKALIVQAAVHGQLLGKPDLMIRYSKQAIGALMNSSDHHTRVDAYYMLAIAEGLKGNYSAAVAAASNTKTIALEFNDRPGLGSAYISLGLIYNKKGQYWTSFENLIEAHTIGLELNDSLMIAMSAAFIGRAFNRVGEPGKALNYYHASMVYATPFFLLWPHMEDMAYAHFQLKQYDSVIFYQQKYRHNIARLTEDRLVREKFKLGFPGLSTNIQLERKQYDSVLLAILPGLHQLRKDNDVIPLMQSLLMLGKVYEGKADYPKSLQYGRELYQIANRIYNRQFVRDASRLLSSSFDHLKIIDSSYFYFKKFSALKDSMETAQYAGRTALYLAASESENKIRLLRKDKEISEQQLILNKKELEKQGQLKKLLAAGLILLCLFFLVIFRYVLLKRKNEKLQNEHEQSALRRKALELEMQALRAQMNPHFIFNCLSAIDNLIQTNQADKATTCLSRFAKLIRGVLDSSKNNLVPFHKDFETLRLYLEMEQFRCSNKFTFELDADSILLQSDYKVPPLIIQPFVENAINHGLLNKQNGSRYLMVNAQLKDEHIIYSVTDNGVGREEATIIKLLNKPNQHSYGIEITKERVQLHNRNGIENDVVITDLEENGKPCGTRAIIRINCWS